MASTIVDVRALLPEILARLDPEDGTGILPAVCKEFNGAWGTLTVHKWLAQRPLYGLLKALRSKRPVEDFEGLLKSGEFSQVDKDKGLIEAVYCEHTAAVKALLEAGSDVRAYDFNAFCLAIGKDNEPILKAMLSAKKVDLIQLETLWREEVGESLLQPAIHRRQPTLLAALLAAGLAMAVEPQHLHAVARLGYVEHMEMLLGAGVAVNADNGRALRAAAERGQGPMIRALLAAGADVHIFDEEALALAVYRGHIEAASALIAGGANVNARQFDRHFLCQAAMHADAAMVKLLLHSGADVASLNSNDCSMLEEDTYREEPLPGPTAVLLALLQTASERREHPSTRPDMGPRAPSKTGWTECVAALLAAGADANETDVEGVSLMEMARQAGLEEVVALLVEAGADMEVPKNGDDNALEAGMGAMELESDGMITDE